MTARLMQVLAVVVLFTAACDDSPTGPSGLNGDWGGTYTYETAGVTVTDDVTTNLNASGASLTGAWTTLGGTSGQFTLNIGGANVTGSTTIAQRSITGVLCSASAAVTGTAASNRIELTLSTVTPTTQCPWAAAQRFVLVR